MRQTTCIRSAARRVIAMAMTGVLGVTGVMAPAMSGIAPSVAYATEEMAFVPGYAAPADAATARGILEEHLADLGLTIPEQAAVLAYFGDELDDPEDWYLAYGTSILVTAWEAVGVKTSGAIFGDKIHDPTEEDLERWDVAEGHYDALMELAAQYAGGEIDRSQFLSSIATHATPLYEFASDYGALDIPIAIVQSKHGALAADDLDDYASIPANFNTSTVYYEVAFGSRGVTLLCEQQPSGGLRVRDLFMLASEMSEEADAPSAGEQTGSGTTDLTMILEHAGEFGGTDEPETNPDDGTPNPYYNPDTDGDGLGDNLAFTVPSSINYVVKADGNLIGPDAGAAYIENRSVFKTAVSSLEVKETSPFDIVENAGEASVANAVDLAIGPAEDMLNVAAYVDNKAPVHDATKWGMEADGAAESANKLGLSTSGHVSNIDSDITSQTKFGEIHWYLTPQANREYYFIGLGRTLNYQTFDFSRVGELAAQIPEQYYFESMVCMTTDGRVLYDALKDSPNSQDVDLENDPLPFDVTTTVDGTVYDASMVTRAYSYSRNGEITHYEVVYEGDTTLIFAADGTPAEYGIVFRLGSMQPLTNADGYVDAAQMTTLNMTVNFSSTINRPMFLYRQGADGYEVWCSDQQLRDMSTIATPDCIDRDNYSNPTSVMRIPDASGEGCVGYVVFLLGGDACFTDTEGHPIQLYHYYS